MTKKYTYSVPILVFLNIFDPWLVEYEDQSVWRADCVTIMDQHERLRRERDSPLAAFTLQSLEDV